MLQPFVELVVGRLVLNGRNAADISFPNTSWLRPEDALWLVGLLMTVTPGGGGLVKKVLQHAVWRKGLTPLMRSQWVMSDPVPV